MKNIIIISVLSTVIFSCGNSATEETAVEGRYGDTTWVANNSITTANLVDSLAGKDSVFAVVKGEIKAACQAKGCWMSMDAAGQDMIVKFKDYGFFVPMNSAGYAVTMQGWAYVDTLSVATQQEYAKDAEKSEEEIAAITEPKVKLSFTADGVIIE